MIDERKLIEELKESGFITDNDYGHAMIDFIQNMPKVGEWVPCSDRLPNTNGVYNVTRKISEGEYKFYISDSAYFDGQDTWHADNRMNHGREYLQDVVAWKSLDEPYKEENNDDIE